jgi:signal transduction histidine kinase
VSLRLQLLLLFTAVLAGTLAVTSFLGLSAAERSVEAEIRNRTTEVATATAGSLRKLSDDQKIDEELAATVRMQSASGLLRAELSRQAALGVDAIFVSAHLEPDGIYIQRWRGPSLALGRTTTSVLEGTGPDRTVRVFAPFADARGLKARLVLTSSLGEAKRLATVERDALLKVAAGSSMFLVVALWIVVGRILVRRVDALEGTMRAVEGGQLDVVAPGPAHGGDELSYLARGFNRMLAQIRGFNAELTRKIEDATAELTRKNRTLEELNELLVAARRDLTAKERLAGLGQLAGTIAHELGNPLNAISGHVQLLARRSDLADPARAQVQIVNAEAQRMAQIIRRFLDQTRGFTPAAEPVRLSQLIDEALDLTLGTEARARVQITREVDPAAERVRTDPGLVRHLLMNLAANAVDAMPQGGHLSLRARREGSNLVLVVEDDGQGMSQEIKRHIFEPFFTTKQAGKGTGLGLAICKEIARGMNGRIEVESEQGKGTIFTVHLPAEALAESAFATAPQAREPEGPQPVAGGQAQDRDPPRATSRGA